VCAGIVALLRARRWQAGLPLQKGDLVVPPFCKGGSGGILIRLMRIAEIINVLTAQVEIFS